MNTLAVQNGSATGAATGAGSSSGNSAAKGSSDLSDPLTNKQTFITLLVAQLKNQDPLNPTDGVQFLSQLTQISSVEQLMNIRQDTDILANQSKPVGGTQGNSSGTTKP